MTTETNRQKDPRLIAAVQFHSLLFTAREGTMADTNTFKRFMVVPWWLTIVFNCVLIFTISFNFALKVHPFQSDFANLILFALSFPFIFWASTTAAKSLLAFATSYRMQAWVDTKFIRGEFQAWREKTSPHELEFALGLPNDSWAPDLELGGIIIMEGHEHVLEKFKLSELPQVA